MDRIAFLREQVSPDNYTSVNETLLHQIAILETADLRNLERSIVMRKAHLKKTKDTRETERLLCELEALEWLEKEVNQLKA